MNKLKEATVGKVMLRLQKSGNLEFHIPTGWSGEKFEKFKDEFEGELRIAISEMTGIAPSEVEIPRHEPVKELPVSKDLFDNI